MKRQTHLYRMFNAAGEKLYVGCTNDVWRRLHAHRRTKPWWPEIDSIEVVPMGWPAAWQTEQ